MAARVRGGILGGVITLGLTASAIISKWRQAPVATVGNTDGIMFGPESKPQVGSTQQYNNLTTTPSATGPIIINSEHYLVPLSAVEFWSIFSFYLVILILAFSWTAFRLKNTFRFQRAYARARNAAERVENLVPLTIRRAVINVPFAHTCTQNCLHTIGQLLPPTDYLQSSILCTTLEIAIAFLLALLWSTCCGSHPTHSQPVELDSEQYALKKIKSLKQQLKASHSLRQKTEDERTAAIAEQKRAQEKAKLAEQRAGALQAVSEESRNMREAARKDNEEARRLRKEAQSDREKAEKLSKLRADRKTEQEHTRLQEVKELRQRNQQLASSVKDFESANSSLCSQVQGLKAGQRLLKRQKQSARLYFDQREAHLESLLQIYKDELEDNKKDIDFFHDYDAGLEKEKSELIAECSALRTQKDQLEVKGASFDLRLEDMQKAHKKERDDLLQAHKEEVESRQEQIAVLTAETSAAKCSRDSSTDESHAEAVDGSDSAFEQGDNGVIKKLQDDIYLLESELKLRPTSAAYKELKQDYFDLEDDFERLDDMQKAHKKEKDSHKKEKGRLERLAEARENEFSGERSRLEGLVKTHKSLKDRADSERLKAVEEYQKANEDLMSLEDAIRTALSSKKAEGTAGTSANTTNAGVVDTKENIKDQVKRIGVEARAARNWDRFSPFFEELRHVTGQAQQKGIMAKIKVWQKSDTSLTYLQWGDGELRGNEEEEEEEERLQSEASGGATRT